MELDEQMAEAIERRGKAEYTLGKQAMQIAVLKWLVANIDKIDNGLADSLDAAMKQERQS